MASDRMMEYYYSMGQDCLHLGNLDGAVTYFRKAANMGAGKRPMKFISSAASGRPAMAWRKVIRRLKTAISSA